MACSQRASTHSADGTRAFKVSNGTHVSLRDAILFHIHRASTDHPTPVDITARRILPGSPTVFQPKNPDPDIHSLAHDFETR